MKKTIVVYGSTTGTCQEFAEQIAQKLGVSDVMNVAEMNADTLTGYDNLVMGTSTWGAGELQDDWYDGVEALKSADLSGKTIALFGCGDADGYSDTFCGGMAEIYNAVKDSVPRSSDELLPTHIPTMIQRLSLMANSWVWLLTAQRVRAKVKTALMTGSTASVRNYNSEHTDTRT